MFPYKKIPVVIATLFFIFSLTLNLKVNKLLFAKQTGAAICGRLPQKKHITIDKLYWQVFNSTSKGLYKLMNAYLDTREQLMIVRVSVIGDDLANTTDSIFCQFWFDDLPESQPVVLKATQVLLMWARGKSYRNICLYLYIGLCLNWILFLLQQTILG
jgi:hypothetical protein